MAATEQAAPKRSAANRRHHQSRGCLICAKHRGQGPPVGQEVWEDEHAVVSHGPVGEDGTTVLGSL
jgi:hypothetical protein